MIHIYRDNAVHFYNAPAFEVVVYLLAQSAIVNYHDLLEAVFGQVLTDEISWRLLPLGVHPPVDPIQYLAGTAPGTSPRDSAVDDFLRNLSEAASSLEEQDIDTGRLMTIVDINLSSVKKLTSADIVVGVQASASAQDPFLVTKRLDPNRSHPYRMTEVIEKLREREIKINSRDFMAITWKHGLAQKEAYCWMDQHSGQKKWSPSLVEFFAGLTSTDLKQARSEYAVHQGEQRKRHRS